MSLLLSAPSPGLIGADKNNRVVIAVSLREIFQRFERFKLYIKWAVFYRNLQKLQKAFSFNANIN